MPSGRNIVCGISSMAVSFLASAIMRAFSSAETNNSSKPIDGFSCANAGSAISITKKP